MGQNDVRRVIWAHRWVFSSSFVLFYINGYFIVFIGFIYDICQRERVGRMGAAKTSPNDTSHVIWALRWVFFSFFVLLYTNEWFIVAIGFIYDICQRERVGAAKTSPNDASHVVWALRWVFLSFFILLYTNKWFIVATGFIYDICQRERVGAAKTGSNNMRHVIWALGELFPPFMSFYCTNKCFVVNIGS